MTQKLEETLEPIFYHYKQARKPQEPFGDFCTRVGFEALRKYSKGFVGKSAEEKLPQVRLGQANLDAVKAIADKQVCSCASPCAFTRSSLMLSHLLEHGFGQHHPALYHFLRSSLARFPWSCLFCWTQLYLEQHACWAHEAR